MWMFFYDFCHVSVSVARPLALALATSGSWFSKYVSFWGIQKDKLEVLTVPRIPLEDDSKELNM
jgi:hypothetical protein